MSDIDMTMGTCRMCSLTSNWHLICPVCGQPPEVDAPTVRRLIDDAIGAVGERWKLDNPGDVAQLTIPQWLERVTDFVQEYREEASDQRNSCICAGRELDEQPEVLPAQRRST